MLDSSLPIFTLILATRNRATELDRALGSFATQKKASVRVIVIDQSSSENQEIIKELCESWDRTQLHVEYRHSTSRGLSLARNEGLLALKEDPVRSDYVAFPDDDCWYSPNLLNNIHKIFLQHQNLAGVLGQFTEPELPSHPRYPQTARLLTTANAFGASVGFFYRRGVFDDARIRFDELIGAGTPYPAAEELDILLRILESGQLVYYDPEIIVFHRVRLDTRPIDELAKTEIAQAYVSAKHFLTGGFKYTLKVIGRWAKLVLTSIWNPASRTRLVGQFKGWILFFKARRAKKIPENRN